MALFMANILIIDDDPQLRGVLREILASNDHQISEQENGSNVLQFLSQNPVDVLITDIIMPEKDGFEVIPAVKKQYPALKVIAISGGSSYGPDSYLDIAKILGADRVFSKPFKINDISQAVTELLA